MSEKEKETVRFLPTMTGKRARSTKARPFWLEAIIGKSEEDGSLTAEKTVAGGSRRVLAGMDVKIYQRTGPFADSVGLAVKVECRASLSGVLTLRVLHPETGKVLHAYVTHREGGEVV